MLFDGSAFDVEVVSIVRTGYVFEARLCILSFSERSLILGSNVGQSLHFLNRDQNFKNQGFICPRCVEIVKSFSVESSWEKHVNFIKKNYKWKINTFFYYDYLKILYNSKSNSYKKFILINSTFIYTSRTNSPFFIIERLVC